MPERFDMSYIGADGNKHRPYMIHRALLGSLERFFGILIEHYAGKFPFWFSPVQFTILAINSQPNTLAFATEIMDTLKSKGFRGKLDDRNEKLGLKIRTAQLDHIPYMLIIGDKEAELKLISVRKSGTQDTNQLTLDSLSALFADFIEKKA